MENEKEGAPTKCRHAEKTGQADEKRQAALRTAPGCPDTPDKTRGRKNEEAKKTNKPEPPVPAKEKSPDLHPDPFPKEHLFQSRILPWLELRTLRILTSSPVLAST